MYRIFCISLLSLSLFAQSDLPSDRGWFAGITLGGSEFSPPDSEPQNDALNDHESSFFGLLGGYRFNKYFGLEGGLFSLGEWTTTVDDTAVEMSSAGHRMLAVGRLPFLKRFAVLGKAGFYHHHFEEKPLGADTDMKTTSETNFNFAAELGFEARITQRLWVTLGLHAFALDNPEFTRTEEDGETTIKIENEEGSQAAVSLGLIYRF